MSQSSSSPLIPLTVIQKNCAYWVAREYQVCLSYVPAGVEVESRDGQFRYREHTREYWAGDSSACRLGVIAHFQGWKRGYYRHLTRPPGLRDTQAVLYTGSGFIPLGLPSLTAYADIVGHALPYNRVQWEDLNPAPALPRTGLPGSAVGGDHPCPGLGCPGCDPPSAVRPREELQWVGSAPRLG